MKLSFYQSFKLKPQPPVTKRDLRQKIFDREQYRLYNQIQQAKPVVDCKKPRSIS
jgi:hypothetical protein